MKFFKIGMSVIAVIAVTTSCKKYQEVVPASFSDQKLYMPAAVDGNSINGVYNINAIAVPGQTFRYDIDAANKKLNIKLSVFRSGITNSGEISTSIFVNNDTITKLIALRRIDSTAVLLPSNLYTLPSSVTIADGSDLAKFDLSINLDSMLANTTKRYALAVGISSGKIANAANAMAFILINPAFLVPTANFSFTVTAATKTVSFANTSTNALSYSWDFGDGTTSTSITPSKQYLASGTYSVTLTARGVTGSTVVRTSSVIIP